MDIPEGKYLGTLCRRGHEWEDSGKSMRHRGGTCIDCGRIAVYKYTKSEKFQIVRKKYKLENKERIKKANADYYSKNYERFIEKNKSWARNNPDKIAKIAQKYRDSHKEYLKAFYQKNKKRITASRNKWKNKNRVRYLERARQTNKKAVVSLSDGYIKNQLHQRCNIRTEDIPQELIELQRMKIKLYRLIKEKTNG